MNLIPRKWWKLLQISLCVVVGISSNDLYSLSSNTYNEITLWVKKDKTKSLQQQSKRIFIAYKEKEREFENKVKSFVKFKERELEK